MNVRFWIARVTARYFQEPARKRARGFGGRFEPIPDVVIFRPGIAGDLVRRNYKNTLPQAPLAVEVGASEGHRGRLGACEIVDDILKLEALRVESRDRGSDVLPTVVTVDTVPEANRTNR